MKENKSSKLKGTPWALIPLAVFLVMYLVPSIVTNDFYKMPVSVSFIVASMVAIAMNRNESINKKVEVFCKGAGNTDIILMVIIFILAGAFAEVAKVMGAVDSTVNLGLTILPGNILLAGVFMICCFISLSIGTSVGTIAALAPMALGIAEKTGIPVGLALGAVVSGAMFGDNLSMISDTTIAATRTQGCEMRDKFKMNFAIVIPAAVATVAIFSLINMGNSTVLDGSYGYSIIKVLPYMIVLIAALIGVNVMLVLVGGTIFAGVVGIITNTFDVWGFLKAVQDGIFGMSELIIISLLIGGMVEVIKYNGGIDFLLSFIRKRIKNKKGAELGIAALVSVVDVCTANNTIAIVMAGPIVKNIADKYEIDPRRAASLLDIFSCFFQGIIPYGAQILTAVGVASAMKISPFDVMKYLYYPYLMGICAVLAVVLGIPKIKN
ncbi:MULTISPECIES: Na+/H+ antiporter NhaC family protein [Clostridium]|uniref:Na(+)/H(+) antiporter NhaC n=2 Tax=Clostridium TaxID=1485 RepID=A0A151ALQ0_9CLOT|nr:MULTISPECIES: Na+/H+ antiporter NhaC family protein [Clostridium]KYH28450.1 Na(+)/H(+) antiporter NhaC [Clostridium colicanis DSM 13634]PRR75720.1 Na(+)/H(+) antiporter NhaC [Clostridium thermopalmarium DSM 5974]PVZ26593.1 putative methionine transporter (NhaC family) [Clostridium thermopalmarium DSM 5974]